MHISKPNSTSTIIHTSTLTPMSAPPHPNPPHDQEVIPDPPIQVSVRDELFHTIIDSLDDPLANHLRSELCRLLRLRGDYNRHFQVVRLIRQLQHIIRHHPNTCDVNIMLLYPVPQFDRPFKLRPGYATGKHDIIKKYFKYSPKSGGYGPH